MTHGILTDEQASGSTVATRGDIVDMTYATLQLREEQQKQNHWAKSASGVSWSRNSKESTFIMQSEMTAYTFLFLIIPRTKKQYLLREADTAFLYLPLYFLQ